VALLDRNVAPLGGDLNLGLADLGEEQLINLIYQEAALIAQAPEEARPIVFVDRLGIIATFPAHSRASTLAGSKVPPARMPQPDA
jgi:hypothetical protein